MSILEFFQGWFFYAAGDRPWAFAFELLGFVTGIAAVFLIAREKIVGWPIGLVSCAVYMYVYWENTLYSDAILFGVFFVMQIAGWVEWLRRPARADGGELVVRRLTRNGALGWVIVAFALTIVWALILPRFLPDASLVYHDAATTVFSLVAQWLMVRRYIECWILWIAVDVLAPLNYLEKAMYPTAVLFIVYFALAIVGYLTWRKTLDAQETVSEGVA